MFWIFEGWTFFLAIPGLILTLWAQAKVSSTYKKYSRERSRSGLTGAQVAQRVMSGNGVTNVSIERVRGNLTDHYDPRSGTLRLSDGVYDSQSIAALGIAAHESGHAIQHAVSYPALTLRTAIAPAAATGSQLGIWLFMIGMFLPMLTQYFGNMIWLMNAGIILFSAAVVFTLVTVPVEINASQRALIALRDGGYLTADELPKAKKVLDAAAWTYVAAAATAVLMLVRLLILRGARD